MAFAVSGNTTVAASATQALQAVSAKNNGITQHSATYLVTGLTTGSNTFTANYQVSANTCTFSNMNLVVIPY